MSVRGPELTSHENPVTLGESRWSRRGMGWIGLGNGASSRRITILA